MRHWKKAYDNGKNWKTVWGRLTQGAVDKVLDNDAAAFFEPELLRKYHMAVKVIGDMIHFADTRKPIKKQDSPEIEYEWIPAIRVLAISKYFEYKGNQFTDYDEIFMDELVRAKGERNTFNIGVAFKNFVENIARLRTDVRCIIYANAVEELNEIRELFHFVPLPGKFGMYYIQKNGKNAAIIEYLDDSKEWKKRQDVSMAGLLGSKDDSAFTNVGASKLDLDRIIKRINVRNKNLLYKISDGDRVFHLLTTQYGYYFDKAEKQPFRNNTDPVFVLNRSLAGNKNIFSSDIARYITDLWNNDLVTFPDLRIAREFRELLLESRLIQNI